MRQLGTLEIYILVANSQGIDELRDMTIRQNTLKTCLTEISSRGVTYTELPRCPTYVYVKANETSGSKSGDNSNNEYTETTERSPWSHPLPITLELLSFTFQPSSLFTYELAVTVT
jgi:hypothetical protein